MSHQCQIYLLSLQFSSVTEKSPGKTFELFWRKDLYIAVEIIIVSWT